MKKHLLSIAVLCLSLSVSAQSAKDLFVKSDTKISWLGIDYSHVKLIGEFAHFFGAGDKSSASVKDLYFNQWNKLILNEQSKYDIKGAFRKDDIWFDIDMISDLNAKTDLSNIEGYNNPRYTKEDITKFVGEYDLKDKKGIGLVLVAESLNKPAAEAYFHLVALNLENGKILLHERMSGKPRGFGIRNYWAYPIFKIIKELEETKWKKWRKEFK